ncbi:Hypothetical protein GLP15_3371 [Giardia lamblia P15]|uniref:Schlafen AlbA-2 domain-containing protein n=1 Tax=Giardia intestinalis (strain P15) TaxID=658858 RepID=E1EVW8_GIAIA|nr:Hypothetical protein GLP15_3371 [Giardia lamblia P15]
MIHSPLPEFLPYNALLELEEDSRTEFKAIQLTNDLINIVKNYCTKYLNAFINTYGGQLLLGVEDTGHIKGVVLSQQDKDQIHLAIDALINQTVPWVDVHTYSVNFIHVEDKQGCVSSSYNNDRYVIAISVSHGPAPLYFTSFTHKSAYIRRNGSIIKLSADGIVRRFTFGRQTHLVAGDYELLVPDDGQECLPRRFLKYCVIHKSIGFVGRGKILVDAVAFLHNTSQPLCTKVLTFYGQEYVGKTWLVEDLHSIIITDKTLFPALYRTYCMDLGGSGSNHISLKVALVALIHSIDPTIDLGFVYSTYLDCKKSAMFIFSTILSSIHNTSPPLDQQLENVDITEERVTNIAIDWSSYISSPNEPILFEKREPFSSLFSLNPFYAVHSENHPLDVSIVILYNIYITALSKLNNRGEDVILYFRNAWNKSLLAALIPIGIRCFVLATCRTLPTINVYETSAKCKSFYISPLSDVEGGYMAMTFFPRLTAAEAQEFSRLCSGLPRIIKAVCQDALNFSVSPNELLERLRLVTKEDRLKNIAPSLYKILTSLSPELLTILAKLSIFPSAFTEDAALYVIATDDADLHSEKNKYSTLLRKLIINLLLEVNTETSYSCTLESLWKLYAPIREYVHGLLPSSIARGLIDRFLTYICNFYRQLKERLIFQKAKDSGLSIEEYLVQVGRVPKNPSKESTISSKDTPTNTTMRISTSSRKKKLISLQISPRTPKTPILKEISVVPIYQASSQNKEEELSLIYENFYIWQPCLKFALHICYAYSTSGDQDLYDKGTLYGFHLLDYITGFEDKFCKEVSVACKKMTIALRKKRPSGTLEDAFSKIWDCLL